MSRDEMRAELTALEKRIAEGYWRFSRSTGPGLHLRPPQEYRRAAELRALIAKAGAHE